MKIKLQAKVYELPEQQKQRILDQIIVNNRQHSQNFRCQCRLNYFGLTLNKQHVKDKKQAFLPVKVAVSRDDFDELDRHQKQGSQNHICYPMRNGLVQG